MANPVDTGGNVAVDFVWGNMPMQPDDDRGENTLDPELDNHIIATTQYNGFPGYTPIAPFLDTTANVAVPVTVGLTEAAATTALTTAGLVKGAVTTSTITKNVTHAKVFDATDLMTLTSAGHGYAAGDSVVVTLTATGWESFSGTYTITAKTTDTFTFSVAVAADNEGDVTGTVYKANTAGKIASSTPAAGTTVNVGSSVALVKYAL